MRHNFFHKNVLTYNEFINITEVINILKYVLMLILANIHAHDASRQKILRCMDIFMAIDTSCQIVIYYQPLKDSFVIT